ncbi:toxin-antitoxin system YwqK family antitoxin [Mucilaginibacter sp.]|uniref:toxin-antitoxin system YwqK family antitoxin n=1 Tax=Mucilaginibacter sp. TaxID=1882438 RepID=UPI00374D4C4D
MLLSELGGDFRKIRSKMSLRVSYDDLEERGTDSGGGIIYYYQGQPLTGVIEEFKNGVLIGESEFTDGHMGGIQREYYLNGQINEECTIRFNNMEGTFTIWDENGNITQRSQWEKGKQISEDI